MWNSDLWDPLKFKLFMRDKNIISDFHSSALSLKSLYHLNYSQYTVGTTKSV